MTIIVEPGDPAEPAATALLRASHVLMTALFPADSNHYLSIEELRGDDIVFFTARRGDAVVGCGALALREGYGEVKSMYVAEAARGSGAGAAVLARIEAEAATRGMPALRLETGDKLDAAHRMYERAGFTYCGPFGAYSDGPHSVFMEKRLD